MIHIKDDWYVEVDELSYNLCQFASERVEKDGSKRNMYKNVTYHRTLAEALQQYSKYRIRNALQADMTLSEAIETIQNEINKLEQDLVSVTKGK